MGRNFLKREMGWDGIFETWDGMGRKIEWDGMGRSFLKCGMGWDESFRIWDGMGRNFLKRRMGWDGTRIFKRGMGWDGTKNRMGWDGFGMDPGRKFDFSFGTVPFNISSYKLYLEYSNA